MSKTLNMEGELRIYVCQNAFKFKRPTQNNYIYIYICNYEPNGNQKPIINTHKTEKPKRYPKVSHQITREQSKRRKKTYTNDQKTIF